MTATLTVKPTDILRAEHRVIERTLDVVEILARRALHHGAIDTAHARDALEVIRTFADGCHHAKEEKILFPAMEKAVPGFAPAAVMRQEHETGRESVLGMTDAVDRNDVPTFARYARAYNHLMREHIRKEDHCLWPMADQMLDEAAQREVLKAFAQAEIEHVGPGVHEKMLALVQKLTRAVGLPQGEAAGGTCGGGGGGGGGCGCSH